MSITSAKLAKNRFLNVAERLGDIASFLCAIHCIVHPFVMTLLPLLGLGFASNEVFMHRFLLIACVLVLTSLFISFRRHRRLLPFAWAVPGLIVMAVGVLYAEDYSIVLHKVMVTCGGLMVAVSSIVNMRLDRQAGHVHSFSLRRKVES